jgi:parvulin-like peptidyl-prolyl isomerase
MKRGSCKGLALLLAAALLATEAAAGIVEEIVANVNGDVITKSDIDDREAEIRSQLYSRYTGAELDKAIEQSRKTVLVDMINEKLLYQRAQRLGLDLDQVYNSSVDNLKRQNNIKTNEELAETVKKQGMTMEEFRQAILKYNVPDIMINIEVRQKIGITDADAEKYYKEHRDDFSHPTTYTFREIALRLEGRDAKEATALAEKIAAEAAGGADFASLVTSYSEGGTKETGGLVENVAAPDMSPQILEAISKLEPGQISGPVATSKAVMLIKLEERKEAYVEPLADVRPKIDAALQRARFGDELQAYLKRLWAENHIKIAPKYAERYPTDPYR